MNKIFALFFICIISASITFSKDYKIGETVLAYWEPSKLYFIGTLATVDNSVKGGGYLVIFEDGDQAVVPTSLIKPMDLKEGNKILAMWKDKKFYPGVINKIVGRALFIHFDDGDKGWTSWSGIAVKP